jgi:hypothetical protein
MSERHPAGPHRMSARDRQMLIAAYLPVIAFAAVLIAARTSRTRRHQLQAVLRWRRT